MLDILRMVFIVALTAVLSLTGGILFLTKNKLAKKIQKFGPVIAAIVLIYTVFGDIVPEILEEDGVEPLKMTGFIILGFVLCGVFGFLLGHLHHHAGIPTKKAKRSVKNKTEAITMLVVDSVHNFADGIVLGVSFTAGFSTGLTTCLATIAHELPQEVGDFSIMQKAKIPRGKIIKLQLISALFSVPAAVVAYLFGDDIAGGMPVVLSLVAGFLLYIAFSEIVYVASMVHESLPKQLKKA